MAFRRLVLQNFKSFDRGQVEFGDFTVLVGSNAAGKSNVLSALTLLRGIQRHGLEDAISMAGGMEILCNTRIGRSEPLLLQTTTEQPSTFYRMGSLYDVVSRAQTYTLELKMLSRGSGFRVVTDSLTHDCTISASQQHSGRRTSIDDAPFQATIVFSLAKGRLSTRVQPTSDDPVHADVCAQLERRFRERVDTPYRLLPASTLLDSPVILASSDYRLGSTFSRMAFFDFDPKKPKDSVPLAGKRSLDEDGKNLPLVLQRILASRRQRDIFIGLISDLLPFVEKMKVDRFADRSFLLMVKEHYSAGAYLPAFSVSDGTIALACLVVALYFDTSKVVFLEEPERNIHISLLTRLVNLMQDASTQKQIIITTHNPLILQHIPLELIRIATRDANGFSRISRPSDYEELGAFIENDLGLSDLMVQNIIRS